jgi:CheY-like chemotaxis protein
MLRILIVEDEPLFAQTLKHLVELNPLYSVTAVAEDSASALAAVEERLPDLALIDLQLANDTTGFSVAVKLHDLGVLCLFTTGKAPSFPMPDLALGCLVKPFSEDDLVRALKTAEDMLRGREGLRLRAGRPDNLRLCRGSAGGARRRSRPAADARPLRRAARPEGPGGPPLARRPARPQRGVGPRAAGSAAT